MRPSNEVYNYNVSQNNNFNSQYNSNKKTQDNLERKSFTRKYIDYTPQANKNYKIKEIDPFRPNTGVGQINRNHLGSYNSPSVFNKNFGDNRGNNFKDSIKSNSNIYSREFKIDNSKNLYNMKK